MPTTDTRDPNSRAALLGRRLGKSAWNATEAAIRTLVVALLLAAIFHTIQPGMPFGAYLAVFVCTSLATKPIPAILRRLRARWAAVHRHRRPE